MPSIITENQFGQVSRETINDFADIIYIEHSSCRGKLSLYGGQVLSWQPRGQHEVFWLSQSADFEKNKAIRGGIPLCWPWFGDFQGAGNHGFARQSVWQLDDIDLDKNQVKLVISLQGSHFHKLWPSRFSLKQELTFGESFTQILSMSNLSNEDVQYTGALHSYFNVSSPEQTSVNKLSAAKFDDKLTGEIQAIAPLNNCAGPIDRVYYCTEPLTINDEGLNRTIDITPLNTKQWVLWNPGTETAKKMLDIHPYGEREYVCLEAANTQWQKIAAKETLTIGQVINVSQC